jgi:uncharacterized protein YuzE
LGTAWTEKFIRAPHNPDQGGHDMPHFNYDQASDTLYISFAPGEKATGIELNDHILLRMNKAERRAVGLTFFEYSVLAQRTESRSAQLSADRPCPAIRRVAGGRAGRSETPSGERYPFSVRLHALAGRDHSDHVPPSSADSHSLTVYCIPTRRYSRAAYPRVARETP